MKLCPYLAMAFYRDEDKQCLGRECAMYSKCHQKEKKAIEAVIECVVYALTFLAAIYIMKRM